ncbi:hypothetical protein BACPU_06250 [Bacillus pumilus]|nr:hypothetical protein BACPU_06250 [Bacillus pumilus]
MFNVKKVLASVIVFAVSATIFIPFSDAKAAVNQPKAKEESYVSLQQTELQRAAVTQNDPIASTKVVKRKAILGLIDALDNSIDWVVDILRSENVIDGNVARSFKRNKGVISSQLLKWIDVDNIIDTTKKQLPKILTDLGVTKGVAHNIAIAVGYLLRIADILFF